MEIIGKFEQTLHGQMTLTEQQSWIADLLELLTRADGRTLSPAEIGEKLDVTEASIEEVATIFRELCWTC